MRLDPHLLVEATGTGEGHDRGLHAHVLEREPLDAVGLGVDLPDGVAVLLGGVVDQGGRRFEQVTVGVDEDQVGGDVGHDVLSSCGPAAWVSIPSASAWASSSGCSAAHQQVGERQRRRRRHEGAAQRRRPDVDVGRLGAERADGALLAVPVGERVEAEVPHRVAMGDGREVGGGQRSDAAGDEHLRGTGPGGIGVGVVDLEAHDVGADEVEQFAARPCRGGSRRGSARGTPPTAVARRGRLPVQTAVVARRRSRRVRAGRRSSRCRPRTGANLMLGKSRGTRDHSRSAAVSMTLVGCSVIIADERRVDRRELHLRRRADVQADHHGVVVAGLPERVPVGVVEAGLTELLGFSDHVTARTPEGGHAADLGRHELRVPVGQQRTAG